MCVNILLFCRDSLLIFSLGDKRYHSTPKIFAPYCDLLPEKTKKLARLVSVEDAGHEVVTTHSGIVTNELVQFFQEA